MAAVLALSLAGTTGNASETDNLGVKAYEQGEYAKAIDYFSKESGNMNLSRQNAPTPVSASAIPITA